MAERQLSSDRDQYLSPRDLVLKKFGVDLNNLGAVRAKAQELANAANRAFGVQQTELYAQIEELSTLLEKHEAIEEGTEREKKAA